MAVGADRAPRWGERRPGLLARILARLRGLVAPRANVRREALPGLPLVLRRGEIAERYLGAERSGEHGVAGAAALEALERAMAGGEWWPADVWGHRALWHFERAGMGLDAVRAARRIGDVRTAGGDPASARRYYAEAIGEARDIGAEREEGLAALGLGRATLDLGDVTTARRLAAIAIDLLERCGAPEGDVAAARGLRGTEKRVTEEAGA